MLIMDTLMVFLEEQCIKKKKPQDSDSWVPTMFHALLDKKAYFKSCTFSKMLID